ncbi:4-hydroxy-3-methylbut-2-enyl diphosphate reductase [Thermaerobacter sp. PB12/4term]|uniref:4-hydroxy-3-methylbut-2-enyl diphosphate reductase n=1 Tax=Thermaerobacter sp. PB12/4term TaxID=2293838 RepID=UPI000E32913B|nr:4-hydroxy-3-methylbut-2-enyl diphosphate reductase [Thermaerobacter sp. PB12/4term]QIA26750.1 4-hydroxy-3-methylbut-2-enyl diphosphate reductase [Thermaerobacter sp. PB12/4term]
MEVIKISPRGYCYGVVDAIALARRAAADPTLPRPIYILGMIVHNHHVVEELAREGIHTLDGEDRLSLLEKVEGGTVIFTAHGISPQVRRRAIEKGLTWIDATCPDVTRTHELIKDRVAKGFEIIYIGKKGHPEPEGAIGEAPGHVHLIETADDLDTLPLDPASTPKVAVVTQTTLSKWDTEALIREVLKRYPHAEVHNEICLATQLRQEAAVRQAREADVVIVVGDRRSNNSNRLVQVVREIARRPAYLVDSVEQIDPAWLRGARRVGVTAGSSTPSQITRKVIEWLEAYEPDEPAGAGDRARAAGTAPQVEAPEPVVPEHAG